MKKTISIITNSDNKIDTFEISNIAVDTVQYDIEFEYIYEKNFNSAINKVSSDFVIFLDKNDTLIESGLRTMLYHAISFDSDITSGAVYREDIGLIWNKDRVFNEKKINTTLKEFPYLIYDSTLSNKIFKVQFLRDKKIQFIDDNKYSHQFFLIQLMIESEKISVIPKVACIWKHRRKVKGKRRNRLTLDDLQQRISILKEIDKLYEKNLNDECISVKNEMFLKRDLLVYLNDILYGSEDHISSVVNLVREYISSIQYSIFSKLKAIDRLKYYLVKHNLNDELLQVLRWQKEFFTPVAVTISNRVYGAYPFFEDKKYQIPNEIFDITNELQVVADIEKVKLKNGKLHLKGFAHFDKMDYQGNYYIEKQLIIKNKASNKEFAFALNNVRVDDDKILKRGNGYYYYLFAGFDNEISLAEIMESLNNDVVDVFIALKYKQIEKKAYVFSIINNELIVDYNKQAHYEMYSSNVGSPTIVNDLSINDNKESLVITGISYLGFEDLDEEHYFIRNLILRNKVTNETHRLGVHSNIMDDALKFELENGLIFHFNIEFKSYIPKKYQSGIWDVSFSCREADGFEFIAPIKNEQFGLTDGKYQLNQKDFYVSLFSTTDKNLNIHFINKNHQTELKNEFMLKKAHNQINKLQKKLEYMEESFSWKITKPIRIIRSLFSKK